jgi:phosphatidylserine/phosphatidylglycerophosphate/cardiolipin synthase-like enzyme
VVAAVLAALLVATPGPAAGARAGFKPAGGAHFNNPNGDRAAQKAIEDVVYQAVEHTRKGDEIRISLFSFDRQRMADALIRAFRRGVAVQLLLNQHQTTKVMKQIRGVIGSNRARRSFIYQCERGCRGGSFLHSKFYLFSRSGEATDVTMVGSNNFTTNAQVHQWNDLLVLNDRPNIYAAFKKTFEEMKLDQKATPLYRRYQISPTTVLHVFPFHNATPKNDPLMKILSEVHCRQAARGYGTNGRTRIRIDQHRIGGERGAWIARRLVQLWGQGCDIKVMHGSVDEPVKKAFRTRTKRGLVPVRANGFDYDRDGFLDTYTHHKYMTISGNYGDNRSTDLVMTGSSNWAGIGVTGDEVVFLTESTRYRRQYERNWNYIWNHGSRPVTYRRQARATTTYRSVDGSVVDGGSGSLLQQDEPIAGGKHWEND